MCVYMYVMSYTMGTSALPDLYALAQGLLAHKYPWYN